MSINPFKNQRGETTMIIIGVVVLAVIGAAIWYAVAHSHKSVATTPAAKATQSACLKLYNDNTICNFAVSASALQSASYTATASSTANGATTNLTIKSDGKGNTEVTTSASGQTVSYISLNGNTYLQEPTSGSWIEYPASSSPTPGTTTDPTKDVKFSFTAGANRSTFTKVGTVSCGSLTCVKYNVTDPTNPGSTFTVWIDTTNYRLQQWQSTSNGTTVNMTFSFGPVTISTPSPVTTL